MARTGVRRGYELVWVAEWPLAWHLSDDSSSMSRNLIADHLVHAVVLKAPSDGRRSGLRNLTERAEQLGGELELGNSSEAASSYRRRG